MADYQQLETLTRDICDAFDVFAPPVPIEIMLQKPHEDMWEEVDVNQLSGSFLSIKDRYSPRMSLSRLLARHIAGSQWGTDHDINNILDDEDTINAFARMLIMPEDMVMGMSKSARNPKAMSMHFEVPEDDARQRLLDLA